MSRSADLPTLAWTVLKSIGDGAAPSSRDELVWVEAFRQIRWLAMKDGKPGLTAAGEAALHERQLSLGNLVRD
jgi:hypothetical protein